jgi:hypothetical protein
LGVWAAPGAPEARPKGGGRSPPPSAMVSGAPGAAQTPNMTDFRSWKNWNLPPKLQPHPCSVSPNTSPRQRATKRVKMRSPRRNARERSGLCWAPGRRSGRCPSWQQQNGSATYTSSRRLRRSPTRDLPAGLIFAAAIERPPRPGLPEALGRSPGAPRGPAGAVPEAASTRHKQQKTLCFVLTPTTQTTENT